MPVELDVKAVELWCIFEIITGDFWLLSPNIYIGFYHASSYASAVL